MIKKIISHITLYLFVINLLSTLLFTDITYANKNPTDDLKIQGLNAKNIDKSQYADDRVIVKFKKNKSKSNNFSTLKSKVGNKSFKKLDYYDKVDVGVLSFDENTSSIITVINELKKIPEVEYVEKDYIRNTSYTGVTTNDTRSAEQWYLKSIQADDAWKIYNDTSDKITVSINDSGIDYTHPDLSPKLKDLSTNCKSDTGATIVGGCPNFGLNYEDILFGTTSVLPYNDIYDINGHGSHVAGIIGAKGNNGTGVIGVSQNVEMIGARLESYNLYDGVFYVSNIIKGINFAIQNGTKVINASYGGPNYSQAEYDALLEAKNNGILFVTAAGNEGVNSNVVASYPDGYDLDNILAVASVGSDDNLAYYSNYGNVVIDVAAPGGNSTVDSGILSTTPQEVIVFEDSLSTLTGNTALGTNPDWYLYAGGFGYHTQTPLYYTGGLDYKLFFDQSFSLEGADAAKLKGYLSCDFGTGYFDTDTNDRLSFYVFDNDSTQSTLLDIFYKDYSGYIEIPFTNPAFFKNNLNLWINFITDNDNDIGQGCRIDNLSIEKFSKNSHGYKSFQGTSMATPVVTGLASMLWSYKPDLSYNEVKDIIMSSVDLIPSLNGKVVSNGKVNAKNAIKELIRRYGITKNGSFENDSFSVPFINLDGKDITLSGSTIDFNSSGTVISMSGSSINGNGFVNIGTGTSIYNNGIELFSTSNDFDIILKDELLNNLSGSGITSSGNNLIVDYSGTYVGTGLYLDISTENLNLYNGPISHNLSIPITNSFTGTLNIKTVKYGDIYNSIDNSLTFNITSKNFDNFTFNNVLPQTITGSLSFASGAYTNNTTTNLNLTSSVYPVNYAISGDITNSLTGTLNNNGSLAVNLTSGEGLKNVSITYTSTGGTLNTTYTGSITLDQTLPALNFLSYLNNEKATSSSISLTGTLFDQNGISSFTLNGSGVVLSGYNFTKTLNLNPGDNIISYQAIDYAGNTLTGTINIIRIGNTSNTTSKTKGNGLVNISFNTELTATGEILYGTSQNALSQSKLGISGTNHSIDLTGLTPNTQYFYQVRGNNNGYTGSLSDIYTFTTPISYNLDNNSGNNSNTGSLVFIGTNLNSSGAIFNSTGSVTINNGSGTNNVVLSLSGLIIYSNGWNGIFNPPVQSAFSGSFNNSSYTHIPALTFKIGNDDSELSLSGNTAQVNIFVGTSYNGKTLGVFRSTNNGSTYNLLKTCLVSAGICSFTTDQFSLFTLGSPVATTGGSSSSSSTSGGGSSSGGSSSGGFGGSVIAATCIDTQLECRATTTENGYKWYRKDGVSCEGGNLGTTCNMQDVQLEQKSNTSIEKFQPVKYLNDGYEFKSKILESVFNKKISSLITIDNVLSSISYLGNDLTEYMYNYRNSYNKLLDSIHKIDDLLSNKDINGVRTEFKNFLQIHKELSNFKYEGKVKNKEIDGNKISYLLYNDSKITKIQNLLLVKLEKKKSNSYMYRLANKVVYNLNTLLTDKTLTKDEIMSIREETISYYKQFIIEYNKLPNK
ncbi:MAG: S8 family serine peptidase [Candidatus Gracilibacteria bacterium]|nr:S8 family serine peptidase [Candidatus Gracilibacteria bacterium]